MVDARSVYTGPLKLGSLKIPVSIYKTTDDYGLHGSLYHDGCGGKIRERRYCETHGDTGEDVAAYSGIDFFGNVVPINPEDRDKLLGRSEPLQALSIHKLSEIPRLMLSGDFVVNTRYMVTHPNVGGGKLDLPSAKVPLATLFQRLSAKKSFLLCKVGLSGCQRFAALLPDGQLLTLFYREELRDFPQQIGTTSREYVAHIDEQIAKCQQDFPLLTLRTIKRRIDAWHNKHFMAGIKRPRTGKKKQERTRVSAH